LVIDTNALVFAFTASPRLSARAAAVISDEDCDRIVSTATFYEIGLKHARGRLPLSPKALARGLDATGLRVVAPSRAVMIRAAELDWAERDPWDRIVAATALLLAEGRVASSDQAFDAVEGIVRVW
jgi:PIN domain nuclease of toxin-antitoxin system